MDNYHEDTICFEEEQKTELDFDRQKLMSFFNMIDSDEITTTNDQAAEQLEYAYHLLARVVDLENWAVHIRGYDGRDLE